MPKIIDLTTHNADKPYEPRGFPQATLTVCKWQKIALWLLVIGLVVWAIADWRSEIFIINLLLTIFYLASTLYRMLIIELALQKPREIQLKPEVEPKRGSTGLRRTGRSGAPSRHLLGVRADLRFRRTQALVQFLPELRR